LLVFFIVEEMFVVNAVAKLEEGSGLVLFLYLNGLQAAKGRSEFLRPPKRSEMVLGFPPLSGCLELAREKTEIRGSCLEVSVIFMCCRTGQQRRPPSTKRTLAAQLSRNHFLDRPKIARRFENVAFPSQGLLCPPHVASVPYQLCIALG
jgi:hypothetical protein